jgi:hypothetical protein
MNISQPTDWYKVSREDVYQQAGGQTLLEQYYGNSLYKALVCAFPDMEIQPWEFEENVPRDFWKSESNRWYFVGRNTIVFTPLVHSLNPFTLSWSIKVWKIGTT